jgi:hypothetical protein
MRTMLGEPDKSLVLVQSQVEAYMLTLVPVSIQKWVVGPSILPIDTSSWDSLPYTRTRKTILLEDLCIPWPQRG